MNKNNFKMHYIELHPVFGGDDDLDIPENKRIIQKIFRELGIDDNEDQVSMHGTPEAFSSFVACLIKQVRYHIAEE